MSFGSGYRVAINAASSKRAGDEADRRSKQADLENRIRGYVKDEKGNYVPDKRGQLAEQSQANELEKKVTYQEQQLELMRQTIGHVQSIQNTRDMTDALLTAIKGRPQDTQKILNNNPILMNTLKSKGVNQVAAVDWRNDKELFRDIPNLNISDATLKDDKKLNALNSLFMKVQKPDGSWYITSTEQLLHESNTKRYMHSTDINGLEDRVAKLGAILKGTVLSNSELEAKRAKVEAGTAQADLTTNVATETNNAMMSWLQEHPDKTINDYNNELVANKSVAQATGKIEVANQKEQAKLANSQIDFTGLADSTKAEETNYIDNTSSNKGAFRYSNDVRNKAKQVEFDLNNGKLSLGKVAQKDMIEAVDIVSNFAKADGLFAKIKNKNAIDKFKAKIKSYYNDDKDATATKEDIQRVYAMADATLKTALTKYIKMMSGAAVTDEERQLFINIISGGEWASGSELHARLASFNDTVKSKLNTQVSILDDSSPYSVLGIKEAMINSGFYNKHTPEPAKQSNLVVPNTTKDTYKPGTNRANRPAMIPII